MEKPYPDPGMGPSVGSSPVGRWTLSRLTTILVAVVVLLNAFALGVAFLALARSRRQVREVAAGRSQGLARILERDLEGTLQQMDLALIGVKGEAERRLASGHGSLEGLDEYIQGIFTHIPYLDSIRVTGPEGDILFGTLVGEGPRVNLEDRDYFRYLRDTPHSGLVISRPLVSRFNGRWVVVAARRLERPTPNGTRFAGMVYANITLDQLSRTLSLVDAGPHGTATLLGQDLVFLASHPSRGPQGSPGSLEMEENLRSGQTSGTLLSWAGAGGREHTVSFRRLPDQPIWVVVELAATDYMAPLGKEALQVLLVLGLFLLLTLALAGLSRGYWRRDTESRFNALVGKAQAALYQISEAAQEAQDLQDLFRRIHGIIDGLLPSRNFYLALYDEDSDRVTFPYFVNEQYPPPPPRTPGKGLTDLVLKRGAPLLLSHEELETLIRRDEVHTRGPNQPLDYLGVPLVVQRRIIGVLAVETYTQETRYSRRDVELLQFVSAQVASSVERKRAEEERRRLEGELHHAQRLESIGNLAGGVAHDMNNVLGAIFGMASFLQDRHGDDPTLLRSLGTILRSAVRGSSLVKNLSEFARKGLEEPVPVDLNGTVRREMERLAHIGQGNVDFREDLERGLPRILGDPSVIGSCLLNLTVNALDAMPQGGSLLFSTRSHSDAWVELSVQDTGHGMPQEVLDKAMDPFFTTKPIGKGAGMGLSLVYGAMRAHGGTVDLTSEVGQGTTVRLRFPAMPADMH